MDEQLSTALWRIPILPRRRWRVRVIPPRHRDGHWSAEEAARELHRRRPDLIAQLARRADAGRIFPPAREEIVDDAITAVVMSPRGVANEHHLVGAFWLAVDHRCRRHLEGRHLTRLGSRQRVAYDVAAQSAPADGNPFDSVELRDRFARAADLMAELDARERAVVAVMASNGVGPVPAARLMGISLGEARSAARSANAKLDRVAAISAAGRMCQFRARAIAADAVGAASDREARLAQAHVSACVPCGRVYRQLRREMRGREFQRAAAAAFLPLPAVPVGHLGGWTRIAVWIEQRISFLPRGGGERAGEVLGGAGIAKATAAGAALVIAGGALTGHIVHAIDGARAPAHHRRASQAYKAADLATGLAASDGPLQPSSSAAAKPLSTETAPRSSPVPPSKGLGYLALGGPSAAGDTADSRESSSPARATVASVHQSAPESSSEGASNEGAQQPSQSGGGASLSYLGK